MLIIGVSLVVWVVVAAFVSRRRRIETGARAIAAWTGSTADARAAAVRALLDDAAPNAGASFLLAADHLRHGRVKEASREFGIAYHGDYRLEAAALLTFACLKAREGSESDIVEQIVRTWQEMKRPALGRTRIEQALLQCLVETTRDPPPLSPIGRLIWSVVPASGCSQIEQHLIDNAPAWATCLRAQSAASESA